MKKYEQVTLLAMDHIKNNNETPEIAWKNASIEVFGKGTSSQKKSCPKNSFLGICEEGLIKEIPKGNYSNIENNKNKKYVLEALELISNDKTLLDNKMNLWLKINSKKYNQQLDVLFTLINEGYIQIKRREPLKTLAKTEIL